MTTTYLKTLTWRIVAVVLLTSLTVVPKTFAAAPVLSLSSVGGDSVQISITGADAGSSVNLYYNIGSSSGNQARVIGNTDNNGNFIITISSHSYQISPNTSAYVVVNGQQSQTLSWPYNGGGSNPNGLSISQTSVTISSGQSTTINISGGSGAFYVASTSNPGAVQVGIGSGVITITAVTNAATSITVCDATFSNRCGTIGINGGVGSPSTTSSGSSVSFNPTSTSVAPGSTQTVSISGNGNYSISSNSNSNVVSPSLSGNTLSLYGITSGVANVTVCQQSGGCSTLPVVVGGANSGIFTFSQTNPVLTVGQSTTLTIAGGSGVYSLSTNSNYGSVNASLSGNTITLSGTSAGTATLTFCDTQNSCGSLLVRANPVPTTTATPTNVTTITTTATPAVSIAVPSAILDQITAMENQLNQLVSQLAQLKASIRALTATSPNTTRTTVPVVSSGSSYKFTSPLGYGDNGEEVKELQKRLIAEGYLTTEPTGYYGTATENAVKAYQRAKGLTPLGNVGPGTRAALNGY